MWLPSSLSLFWVFRVVLGVPHLKGQMASAGWLALVFRGDCLYGSGGAALGGSAVPGIKSDCKSRTATYLCFQLWRGMR